MKSTLHHKFIAGIVGLSILITTGAAAPARADDRDAGRALAAILGLAIVGVAIAESKKDKKRAKVSHPKPHVKPHHDPYVQPRHKPRHAHGKVLPQRCLRNFPAQGGHFAAFGSRCLDRHYKHAAHLPGRCYTEVWTDRGTRGVYGARCLRHKGFKLARR